MKNNINEPLDLRKMLGGKRFRKSRYIREKATNVNINEALDLRKMLGRNTRIGVR